MTSRKNEDSIHGQIKAVIRLDLPKLGARSLESHMRTPNAKQRNIRVASVATIRVLLVTFTELRALLKSICSCNELRSFYESRRILADRVLPETLEAFEYCRQVLRLRGSTDSPIASKLAQLAYAVGDSIEYIKDCVDIAREYHELRYETIAEITKFAEANTFVEAQISPLLFSIEVTLPLRLEIFAARASRFPDGVQRLSELARIATASARSRIDSVRSTAEPIAEPAPLIPSSSPRRPSIRVLRGVRVRQPLTSVHERIPSIAELPQPQLSPSGRPPSELPQSKLPHSKSQQPDSKENTVRTEKQSRLRAPTRIENRRVVDKPRSPLREVLQPKRMNSRIFRPTQIAITRRSASSALRTPGNETSAAGFMANASANLSANMTADSAANTSENSSFDLTLEETPLAHKSTRTSPNGSAQLVIPRRRPPWVRA